MAFIDTDHLFSTEVINGYEARTIHTGTMTFVYWTVAAGAEMPVHNHLHEQVAHVLEGRFELTVDGETQTLEPGKVAVIPPYIKHGGRALTACKLLDVFLPERDDYKFEETKKKQFKMANQSVQEGYNTWAATYDSVENKTRDADAVALQTVLGKLPFTKVLEAGCGTGKNTVWLAQKATSVTAMDFSEGMLQQAAQKVAAPGVTFVQADLQQKWPFERSAFDVVTCNLVLEHIQDLQPVFAEAARVLKSGGFLFVCELHPYKQYGGSKARYEKEGETHVLPCFVHHASDYFKAAIAAGLQCQQFDEWFDEAEKQKPRVISFLFQKA